MGTSSILDILRVILLVCTVLVFVLGWNGAVKSGDVEKLRLGIDQTTNALVFLFGLVLVQLLELLLFHSKSSNNSFIRTLLTTITIFLAVPSKPVLRISARF